MVAEDIEYRQEEPEEKTEENKAQKEWESCGERLQN